MKLRSASWANTHPQLQIVFYFQFTANSEEGIEAACEKVQAKGVDCVDLNIGCPAKNIVQSGSGSALMADPVLLEKIVKKLRAHLSAPFCMR